MPLAINIHELIHGQVIERERLEFKRDWNPKCTVQYSLTTSCQLEQGSYI